MNTNQMAALPYRAFVSVLSLSLFIIFLSSCGQGKTDENNSDSADTTTSATAVDTANKTQQFFYSLPSPLVMMRVFKRTGLKYVDGVANSPDNITKYSTAYRKTLNLGIYSADLAYTVLNKQSQQASKYMEAVKRLSDDLGMASLFDTDDYLTRFKNNLNNEDSLINVVSELKSEMDVFMRDNDKEKQTLLIFIGAWVENMYIATQLTKDANKDKVAMRVAEQKFVLNSLMNVIPNFQNDAECKDLFLKLNELKTFFDSLTVQGDNENVTIDQLQLKAITEKTKTLRKEIVG